MKNIKGRILEGEQLLVVFKKKENPKVGVLDSIRVKSRRFKVLSLELGYGVISARVEEKGETEELDYSFFRRPYVASYPVHLDIEDFQ